MVSVLLPLLLLAGADLSGIWIGKMATRNGEFQDIAFQLTQNGSKLTGKMYGDYQSTPIAVATIAGDVVTFVINAQEQSGNQINETRIRFTGKINGDEMELFRERESSVNAGNGGAVQIKNTPKQVCRLKRLP